MPTFTQIIWDDGRGGNVEHLAEHGVTPREAESVIRRYFDGREPSKSIPKYWVVRGRTRAGRYLLVVFEYFAEEGLVNPVTAFEPEM